LHDIERPTAQQTAVIANQQRDSKKQPKPFSLEDFSIYKPRNGEDMPRGHYGSAAMALIKAGKFPSWALFCYKELAAAANDNYVPAVAGFVSDNAILLHPVKTEDGYKGLLIAMEAASGEITYFETPKGEVVPLRVPEIGTKVVAEEDVVLLKP